MGVPIFFSELRNVAIQPLLYSGVHLEIQQTGATPNGQADIEGRGSTLTKRRAHAIRHVPLVSHPPTVLGGVFNALIEAGKVCSGARMTAASGPDTLGKL